MVIIKLKIVLFRKGRITYTGLFLDIQKYINNILMMKIFMYTCCGQNVKFSNFLHGSAVIAILFNFYVVLLST